ncbi:hypothetical protein AB0L40_26045 [Patulibacter sp. NPDC049589]|uniref:hypothetical protein n=1 Tax=Patulibacter sp. NPDC049589 TaxID=3154731 RepID=UPI00341DE137
MRRRTPTAVAVLCGGGPADGETRPIEDGALTVVIPEGPSAELHADDAAEPRGARRRAHVYERHADGRFFYLGPVVLEDEPELPARTHADVQAMGLAALGHDKGPSALAIVTVIVALTAVMMLFNEYS